MNGIISKGGKPVKEENIEEVAMANTEYSRAHNSAKVLTKKANSTMKLDHIVDAIKAHKEALKFAKSSTNKAAHTGHIRDLSKKIIMAEETELDEKKSDYEDQIKAYLAKGGKIQKGDKPNKRKIDMVTKGFMKKYGAMKKKEADLDAKDKEELEKMMGEAVIQETWLDDDAKKVQPKWKKMDKKAKKKWMDGVMAKAKKEGMPKDELMDVLDDYGLLSLIHI